MGETLRVDVPTPAVDTPPTKPETAKTPETKPTWLPEKFKSPEDLAKAYAELEAKQSTAKPEAPKPDAPSLEIPKAAPAPAADTLAPYRAEFAEKGELSKESYEKLGKLGYSKDLVDNYIEGVRARAAREEEAVHSLVGGKARFQEMAAWASENLPEAEITHLNTLLSQGGESARTAAAALAHSYSAKNPQILDGSSFGASLGTYQDFSELTRDMAKPEYKSDESFRKRVAEKLARSNNLL